MEEYNKKTPQCASEAETLAYISGEAASASVERIEAHIAQCSRCFHLINSFASFTLLIAMEDEPGGSSIPESVYDETKTAARALIKERISDELKESSIPESVYNETKASALALIKERILQVGAQPSKEAARGNERSLRQILFQWFWAGRLGFAGMAAALLLAAIIFSILWRDRSTNDMNIARGSKALIEAVSKERPTIYRMTELPYAPSSRERGGPSSSENLNAAYAAFNAAVLLNPTPAARHGLGRVLTAMARYDSAVEEFQKAQAEAPDDASILIDLAVACAARGETEKAVGILNRALEIDPSRIEAIFNRALLYKKLEKYDEARKDWQIYLEVDSASPWADEARTYLAKLERGDISD
jgi:tetratricopeptide (TPR) repeat protein